MSIPAPGRSGVDSDSSSGGTISRTIIADEDDGPDLEAERLDDALAEAREREVRARLELSAVEQRGEELGRRVEALLEEAEDVEQQLAERERRRAERLAAIERCGVLAQVTDRALRRTEASLELAGPRRPPLVLRPLGAASARVRGGELLAPHACRVHTDFEDRIVADLPWLFLWHEKNRVGRAANLKGLRLCPLDSGGALSLVQSGLALD